MKTKIIFEEIETIEKRLEGLLQERERLLKENRRLLKDREETRERVKRLMAAVEQEIEKAKSPAPSRKRGRKKKGAEE